MNQKIFKSIRRILLLLGLLIGLSAIAIVIVYQEGTWAILTHYKKSFTEQQSNTAIAIYGNKLPEIDEVCVLTLVESDQPGNLGAFTAPYTNQRLFILSSTILVGEEAQEIGAHWRKLVFGDGGAGCFEPHHVLQFRYKKKVICESVVCFLCSNLTLPAFPSPVLIGFHDANVASTSTKIQSLIERAGK